MSKQTYKNVIVEKQDRITWVIMNCPEKRNAMSSGDGHRDGRDPR